MYGNLGHQYNTRLYMDFLRTEGEDYFLAFLPADKREAIRYNWYKGIRQSNKKDLEDIGIKIHFLPLDFNNLVSKLTATFDWEMVLIGLTGGIEPYFGKNV